MRLKLNLGTIRQVIEAYRPALLIIAQKDFDAWDAAIFEYDGLRGRVDSFCGVPVVVADVLETVTVDFNLTIRRVF